MLTRRDITLPEDAAKGGVHYWYHQNEKAEATASVAHLFHSVFRRWRWELMIFEDGDPIVVRDLQDAESKLQKRFGEIKLGDQAAEKE